MKGYQNNHTTYHTVINESANQFRYVPISCLFFFLDKKPCEQLWREFLWFSTFEVTQNFPCLKCGANYKLNQMLTEKEKTRVIPLRSVGCVILYIGVPKVIKWKYFESISLSESFMTKLTSWAYFSMHFMTFGTLTHPKRSGSSQNVKVKWCHY